MNFRGTRATAGATGIVLVGLLGVVSAGVQAAAAGQNAQTEQSPQMAEDVLRDIQVLRGIPLDEFMNTMGMFAAALGYDCSNCHAPGIGAGFEAFADPTPEIQTARRMVVMMNAINESYFGGEERVTCFTCHSGNQSPRSDPNLALQYGTPVEDPNVRDFPTDPTISADQVFDRYLQVLGGTERLNGISSFVAEGTYAGFDTSFAMVPVQIFAKAPDQHTTLVHMSGGDSVRTYDGRNGWMAGPFTPLPLLTLSAGNLDRARLEAMLWFPSGIRQAFSEWRVGRAVLGDLVARHRELVGEAVGGWRLRQRRLRHVA